MSCCQGLNRDVVRGWIAPRDPSRGVSLASRVPNLILLLMCALLRELIILTARLLDAFCAKGSIASLSLSVLGAQNVYADESITEKVLPQLNLSPRIDRCRGFVLLEKGVLVRQGSTLRQHLRKGGTQANCSGNISHVARAKRYLFSHIVAKSSFPSLGE